MFKQQSDSLSYTPGLVHVQNLVTFNTFSDKMLVQQATLHRQCFSYVRCCSGKRSYVCPFTENGEKREKRVSYIKPARKQIIIIFTNVIKRIMNYYDTNISGSIIKIKM